jgi:hypothetical protein
MSQGRFVLALCFVAATAAALAACSSKSKNNNTADAAPPVQCDDTLCGPRNKCIDDGSGSGPICRETCTAQTGAQGCPWGYFCNDGVQAADAGTSSATAYSPPAYCEQLTGTGMTVTQDNVMGSALAPWGVPCAPSKGESGNTDCDTAQNFACYGTRPVDANAFCTQFGCTADSDCPGGWWCATENTAPNVKTSNPSFGQTRTVCLPREFCSPCVTDHDCTSTTGNGVDGNGAGYPLHCVAEPKSPNPNGGTYFCAHTCKANSDCNQDDLCQPPQTYSVCLSPDSGTMCTRDEDCPAGGSQGYPQHCELQAVDGGFAEMGQCTPECGSDSDCDSTQHCMRSNVHYCTPRAGACKGAGNFCDPCRSDADCPNGYCMQGQYSLERFCSVKTTMPGCDPTKANPPACPMRMAGQNWKATACLMTPANQCVGLITIGASTGMSAYIPGCWTTNE